MKAKCISWAADDKNTWLLLLLLLDRLLHFLGSVLGTPFAAC